MSDDTIIQWLQDIKTDMNTGFKSLHDRLDDHACRLRKTEQWVAVLRWAVLGVGGFLSIAVGKAFGWW